MEAGLILFMVAVASVGALIGMWVGKTRVRHRYERDTQRTQGVLNVDCSDQEFEPGLFLGLSVPVKEITSREYAVFKINVFDKDSRG